MRGARWSAALMVGAILAGAPAHANSGGRVGRSGRQNQTCNECHSGGVRPDVALQVPDRVATGETVVLRFTVHAGSPAGRAAGFNVAVEGGALVAIPGQGARVASGEITHSEPKDNDETRTAGWDFQWIAPATPGTYRLWGAGNSVNGNGQSSGDKADALVLRVDVVPAASETPTATASPVPPTGTAPRPMICWRNAASFTAPRTASDSRATIASGRWAGAINAMSVEDSKPVTPASCSVGTSGARGVRSAVLTASIFTRPACRWGNAVTASMKHILTSPESNAWAAGAPPRYGTCTISIPAMDISNSVARWLVAPMPAEEKLISPGRART